MFASALLVPWAAVIAVQTSRIEGKRPVFAITQIAQASLLSLEFIVPLMSGRPPPTGPVVSASASSTCSTTWAG